MNPDFMDYAYADSMGNVSSDANIYNAHRSGINYNKPILIGIRSKKPMYLLVADDNEINLRVACAYLKALGIPVESIFTATNGREATELCTRQQFDLIFMDIQMPEVDGIEATRLILQNKLHQPTIVALTANTSQEAEVEFRAAGMQMVLHKPVNKIAFQNALNLIRLAS